MASKLIRAGAGVGGFRAFGAPNVVGEDEVGQDPNLLYFPNVRVCGTVTIQTAGGLFGFHFTPNTTTAELTLLANQLLLQSGGAPVAAMWVIGRMDSGGGGWSGAFPYGRGMRRNLRLRLNVPRRFVITCFRQLPATCYYYRATLAGGNVTWDHSVLPVGAVAPAGGIAAAYAPVPAGLFEVVPKWF